MIKNLKVSFVAVITFLFISVSVLAQNSKIDSLKSIIETGTKDTVTVSNLISLSQELQGYGLVSESLEYSKKANEMATDLGYKKGLALSLKYMGIAQFQLGNFIEVFENLTESLEYFEAIQDSTGIASILNNLGTVYYSQGSNGKAIDYYLRSLRIAEKLDNPLRIATALVNIAGVYADNNQDYDKTMSYYDQAMPYLKQLNNVGISKSVLLGTGQQYFKKGAYQKALDKFEEALPITENSFYYVENLTLIGQTLLKLGQIEKALEYLDRAHDFATENKQQMEIVKVLIEKGDIYRNLNNKKAIDFYEEAEKMAKELKLNYELADIYQGISEAHVNQGDFKKGYLYQSKFLSQKDSLFNLDTDDKIRGLQFDFDLQKKEDEIGLLEKEAQIQELTKKRQKNVIWVTGIFLFLLVLLAISLFRRYKFTKETNLIIEKEKDRSESLLLNILPEETAQELKEFGKVKAKRFDSVTVLFTDFVGFTAYAKNLEPEELVSSVDYYFSKFDEIMEKYDIEKIKTIGDAYMCVSGLPEPGENDVLRAVHAAFEIIEFIEASKKSNNSQLTKFDIRIGINTGPIVAGIVGTKKFAYDIWGDTVNVASRMESKSVAGRINVSESTYELIKDHYDCEFRGEIDVKNKGMMKMFFVNARK